jgi:hypothetical protein
MKKIYLLDRKLKWETFKELNDKIVKDSGPTPVGMTKILWEMMRDGKILCWFEEGVENDMMIGLKIPKDAEVNIIKNGKK